MHATVGDQLRWIVRELRNTSGDLALLEAEQVLGHVLQLDRSRLYARLAENVGKSERESIRHFVDERRTGKPLPYVLGYAYFASMRYTVSPDVLIPRPDTETVVETVLRHEPDSPLHFVDLGTGSGVLANTLLRARGNWRGIATDLSFPALCMASGNWCRPVPMVCADGLEAIKRGPAFDFAVTNPPYISHDEMQRIDQNVRDFEPRIALDGGEDGLFFYRYLSEEAGERLKRHGRLYAEIDASQAALVCGILQNAGWSATEVFCDLAGRPRVVRSVKGPGQPSRRPIPA